MSLLFLSISFLFFSVSFELLLTNGAAQGSLTLKFDDEVILSKLLLSFNLGFTESFIGGEEADIFKYINIKIINYIINILYILIIY